MKRIHSPVVTNAIAAIFILLFTYTAFSKITNMKGFVGALKASPLLSLHTQGLAWMIVIAEIITVLLLIIVPLRFFGFYLSFALMLLFTVYIGYMLLTSSSLPCSCGGILRQLSWKAHLILNTVLTMLATIGVMGQLKSQKLKPA